MSIDIKNAEKEFIKYVANYDCKNEKVELKIKHTFKVMKISKKVAKSLKLSKEDIELAQLIGLLHDIGRFEQIKRYNTFSDRKSIDHGALGVKILEEGNLIRNFVKDDKYDKIIKTAIQNHNKQYIEEGLTDRELLYCKIVRDADKIDIFRILNEKDIQSTYGNEKIKNEEISEEILKSFFAKDSINFDAIKTNVDKFVCHIAYVFDLYFDYSLKKIRNKKYIEKLTKKINFKNSKTIEQVKEMLKVINEHLRK